MVTYCRSRPKSLLYLDTEQIEPLIRTVLKMIRVYKTPVKTDKKDKSPSYLVFSFFSITRDQDHFNNFLILKEVNLHVCGKGYHIP